MNKTSFFNTINHDFERYMSFTETCININNIVTVSVESDPSVLKVIDVNKDTHYIRAVDFYSRAEIAKERD